MKTTDIKDSPEFKRIMYCIHRLAFQYRNFNCASSLYGVKCIIDDEVADDMRYCTANNLSKNHFSKRFLLED